jgi:hypothetical protein
MVNVNRIWNGITGRHISTKCHFSKIKKVLITGKDAKQISIPTEKIPVKCKIKKTTQNLAKLVPN